MAPDDSAGRAGTARRAANGASMSSPSYVLYGPAAARNRLIARAAAVVALAVAVLAAVVFVFRGQGHAHTAARHVTTTPRKLVTRPVTTTHGKTAAAKPPAHRTQVRTQ